MKYGKKKDDKKYINSKIKIFDSNIETNFQGNGMSKPKIPCDCFSLNFLDSVIRTNDKYYPQTLLEECKYKIKKSKKMNGSVRIFTQTYLITNMIVVLIVSLVVTLVMMINLVINLKRLLKNLINLLMMNLKTLF